MSLTTGPNFVGSCSGCGRFFRDANEKIRVRDKELATVRSENHRLRQLMKSGAQAPGLLRRALGVLRTLQSANIGGELAALEADLDRLDCEH